MLAAGAEAQTLSIDAACRGDMISKNLYGIFFEEINHAGDGGLYAELVANRSFEKHTKNGIATEYWETVGGARMQIVTAASGEDMLNSAQGRAVKVTATAAGQGILNNGYKGINIVNGRTYKLSLFAKADTEGAELTATLLAADKKTVLGQVQLGGLTAQWKKYTATITATGNDPRGKLLLAVSGAATVYMDVVSLFPPTYKNRDNGMRPDLAEALRALNPSFMRFPGGCYVEGLLNDNSEGSDCHYEWKKTVGPIEERPGHFNNNWGYEITDGMGAYEYLQLCEDLGAEPLYVANIGIGHDWAHSINDLGEYIQDALDFIEFANGDKTTAWGRKRADMGHPEPFGLTLLEIGNENNPMGNDVADGYYLRYKQFHDAISAKYPYIKFIGNGEWNSTGWNKKYPADIVDEHYYSNPAFFVNRYNLYDNADRNAPKRYVGEFAVTENFGKVGNIEAALGEAVFMCGMEKNSEAVTMSSYAPIFQNDDLRGWWATEMIHFNNHDLFFTPSYYMQQLFPQYLGHQNMVVAETGNAMPKPVTVGVGSWLAGATYTDMTVTLADGTVITLGCNAADWQCNDPGTSSWTYAGGSITQTDAGKVNQTNVFARPFTAEKYTYEVKATKNSGAEGFIIPFSYADADNYCWLNVGGWGNTKTAIEQCAGGVRTVVGNMEPANIETGHQYTIRIEVDGSEVKTYIDGQLINEVSIMPLSQRMVYTAASISESADMVYLRVVNPYPDERSITVNMRNADVTGVEGVVVAGAKDDENSWSEPDRVKPAAISSFDTDGNTITYTVPPYSANFINISVKNVNADPTAIGKCAVERSADRTGIYTLNGIRLPDKGNLARGFFVRGGKIHISGI